MFTKGVAVAWLEIEWLGQAGFVYRLPTDLSICVDPYLSYSKKVGTRDRLIPIPVAPWDVGADLVVTTHDHSDHFDEASLRPMAEDPSTLFLGPSSCKEHWLKMNLPEERFLRLDQGESLDLMGVKFTALYAEHSSGDQRDATGLVIEGEGLLVYHVGDSEFTERLVENSKGLKPDVLTVPINGRLGNMNYREAAQLTQTVEPRVVIPMHYGMFKENSANPQDFVDACRELDLKSKVVLMQVGKHFRLDAVASPLRRRERE